MHRSRQSPPRSMLDKSESIPYKTPRERGLLAPGDVTVPRDRVSQNSSHLDRPEEYRVDHLDLPGS
jgi:hypothetical protein